MNNPNFQNQPYNDNQRGLGRNRNQSWSSEERGMRPSWREDEQNRFRNRSSWGEQNEYAQSRYSPNFDSLNDTHDRQAGYSRDYDEYGYGDEFSGRGQRAERGWPSSDYENFSTQQDYSSGSPGNSQSRAQFGDEGSRWRQRLNYGSQGPNYGDSGNFGYRSGSGQQNYGGGSSPWAQPGQLNSSRTWDQGSGQAGQFRQQWGDNQVGQWNGQAGQSSGQAKGAYGLQGQNHRGKGPKGYVRTDERIREEICEMLSDDPRIDASEVSVEVRGGVVMLEGSVRDRGQKHRIEDIADSCGGVKDVHNSLRVTSAAGGGLSGASNISESNTTQQRDTDAASKATKQ